MANNSDTTIPTRAEETIADRTTALEIEEKGGVSKETSPQQDSPIPRGYTDQSRVLPPRELAFVFIGLCLVLFMASLDQTIVSVLIPTMGKVFNAPQYNAWMGTSYLITNTAMQPLYGKLSDIYGRRSTILVAVFFFMLGSLLCGAAPTIVVLIIGRAIAGIGAGGMISLTMIIISDVVSLRDRGKYQGIVGSMFGISAVVGPLLGGVFAEKSSWRWAFYINLPIGVVSSVALIFLLKLPKVAGSAREKLARIDFLGSVTVVIGVVCVLLSTNWGGNEYDWNELPIILPYCIGAVFLLAFLYIESRVAVEPILPFRLFKNQSVSAAYATSFFLGGAFMGAVFFCPLYFQMVRHLSATNAGLQLLPLVGGMLVTGAGCGILISKIGRYRPFIWAAMAIFTVGTGLLTLWDEKSALDIQIGFLFVVGLGLGGSMQSVVLAGQCAVGPADIATVTSMLSFFRTMGGVVNVAIGGSMINNILLKHGVNPNDFAQVYRNPAIYAIATRSVFQMCIAWPALGLLASFLIKHHELRRTIGVTRDAKPNTEVISEEKAPEDSLEGKIEVPNTDEVKK